MKAGWGGGRVDIVLHKNQHSSKEKEKKIPFAPEDTAFLAFFPLRGGLGSRLHLGLELVALRSVVAATRADPS
jgi:hypothetical protein